MSLGDDSQVSIDALDGFPGVHSRRWSGKPEDDRGRNEKILKLMKDEFNRSVQLTSRFSLVDSTGEIYKIGITNYFNLAEEIKDTNGFGYDGILIPQENNVIRAYKEGRLSGEFLLKFLKENITIGEMTQSEKNAINNRGKIASYIGNHIRASRIASYGDKDNIFIGGING